MSKSQRPSLRELREIYLLVGECRELGADPYLWREHMMRELARILGAHLSFAGEVRLPDPTSGQPLWVRMIDFGWATESDREPYAEWMRAGAVEENLLSSEMFRTVFENHVRSLTCRTCEYLDSDAWRRSGFYDRVARPARADDQLASLGFFGADRFCLVSVFRNRTEPPFEVRQRRLLSLFHREIPGLVGGRLASFDVPSVTDLPPRLREVLLALLEGDGEKQAASRLGLSRHTVHEHVKRLHRHFKAASRGELLARCHSLTAPLRQLAEDELELGTSERQWQTL